MAFIHPFEHDYDDYVRLAARLRHDGELVGVEDVQVGDFIYVSDGPRLITHVGEIRRPGARSVAVDDTGGPITGGWTTIYDVPSGIGKSAWRGGRDHFMAITDSAEAALRRWQRRTGRKHPAGLLR
jgi:hypothetical protein